MTEKTWPMFKYQIDYYNTILLPFVVLPVEVIIPICEIGVISCSSPELVVLVKKKYESTMSIEPRTTPGLLMNPYNKSEYKKKKNSVNIKKCI